MKKILLIDDHADIRRLIRITLGNGFEILEAGDGTEGLRLLNEMLPDLVVLDVMLPGTLDGMQVLSAVRSSPALNHTHVIMVTACGQQSDYENGMQRGADEYFIKPFSPLKLVATIKAHLLD